MRPESALLCLAFAVLHTHQTQMDTRNYTQVMFRTQVLILLQNIVKKFSLPQLEHAALLHYSQWNAHSLSLQIIQPKSHFPHIWARDFGI